MPTSLCLKARHCAIYEDMKKKSSKRTLWFIVDMWTYLWMPIMNVAFPRWNKKQHIFPVLPCHAMPHKRFWFNNDKYAKAICFRVNIGSISFPTKTEAGWLWVQRRKSSYQELWLVSRVVTGSSAESLFLQHSHDTITFIIFLIILPV